MNGRLQAGCCAVLVGWISLARAGDTLHVRYAFVVRNTSAAVVRDGMLTAYAPMEETASQRCVALSASAAYEILGDGHGGRRMRFRVGDLPPYGSRVISVEADLQRNPSVGEEGDPAAWLDSSGLFDYADSSFREKGPRVGKDVTPRRLYDWVREYLRHGSYDPVSRGARLALQSGRGDCTEYAALFTALCRRQGIPARGVGGFVCAGNSLLKPAGYHNWSEYYQGGRWQIADALREEFADTRRWYVAFHFMTEAAGEVPSLFRVEGEGLHVSMSAE